MKLAPVRSQYRRVKDSLHFSSEDFLSYVVLFNREYIAHEHPLRLNMERITLRDTLLTIEDSL